MKLFPSDIARFWDNVDKRGSEECWNWQGTVTHGYGEIWIDPKKRKSHRVAYYLFNGPFSNEGKILHKCDNTRCCNPFHLYLGTPADNSRDMIARNRSKKGEKHHNTFLTDADIRKIRADKRPQSLIATTYGLAQATVSRIKTRKAWSHVDD